MLAKTTAIRQIGMRSTWLRQFRLFKFKVFKFKLSSSHLRMDVLRSMPSFRGGQSPRDGWVRVEEPLHPF